jgi:two-component system, chemotaxis family, chemotaxis protein CheY
MSQKSILVVDDDIGLRVMFQTLLREEGYGVLEASNGQEALDLLKTEKPNLIVLDLMMPVMNGWQFLEEIEKHPELDATPIILLSASRELTTTARLNKIRAFLPKPFDIDTLLDYIEKYSPSTE